jgi:hypothetical protein
MAMRLPNLPKLLERKIYKTGQTRGAGVKKEKELNVCLI